MAAGMRFQHDGGPEAGGEQRILVRFLETAGRTPWPGVPSRDRCRLILEEDLKVSSDAFDACV